MSMSLASIVGLVLLASVYGQEEPCGYDAQPPAPFLQPRILNGPLARKCEWPWVVAIRENNFPFLRLCAGVLVGRDKVITTASCVQRLRPTPPLQVVLGEHDITFEFQNLFSGVNETIVQVRSITTHPQFNRRGNDIAVLRLMNDVSYNDCVLPVCLPTTRAATCSKFRSRCAFAGWGIYSDRSFMRSATLRTAYGRLFDQDICSIIYRYRGNVLPDNTVCVDPSVSEQRPCLGDEGGMVVCEERGRWILESLLTIPICNAPFPSLGVDIRAQTILDFITNN